MKRDAPKTSNIPSIDDDSEVHLRDITNDFTMSDMIVENLKNTEMPVLDGKKYSTEVFRKNLLNTKSLISKREESQKNLRANFIEVRGHRNQLEM